MLKMNDAKLAPRIFTAVSAIEALIWKPAMETR
jgi:hypothetical protein